MNPDSMMMLDMLGACGLVLAGVVLIVVGAVSARPAHGPAGYLTMAAGALMLVHGCCNVVPDLTLRFSSNYELVEILYPLSGFGGLFLFVLEALLLLAGPVLLARAALARGGAA
jgi:hypothetical protein